jgi:hypothetical protein
MLSNLIQTVEMVEAKLIRMDGGTQMRAAINESTVKEYAEVFETCAEWGNFPPLVAFYDGQQYWLADGFHRLTAWKLVMDASTPVPVQVRSGTRRDAILYAVGANAQHGLRRTNADKRRAVETMLMDDEWSKWSDREIARQCFVSHQFVSDIRRALAANAQVLPGERMVRRGDSVYVQKVKDKLSISSLREIVRRWSKENWTTQWPENPAHTNSRFWIMLTEWMKGNVHAAWNDADLKLAIKQEAAKQVDAQDIGEALAEALIKNAVLSTEQQSLLLSEMISKGYIPQETLGMLACYVDLQEEGIDWSVVARYAYAAWLKKNRESSMCQSLTDTTEYVEVWKIQNTLRQWAKNRTPAQLREIASLKGGEDWWEIRTILRTVHYRDRDLVQALNNLASEFEQKQDDRIERAKVLIALYKQTIKTEDDYGSLTGAFTDWLAPKREIQKLIKRLEELIFSLEGAGGR